MGVDLEDYAVDLVAEFGAFALGLLDELHHGFDGADAFSMRVHAEPQSREGIKRSRLPGGKVLAFHEEKICKENQPAVCDDTWLERAQCSGGRVAGIDKDRQPFALAFLVQALEGGLRHDHLAANFEALRAVDLLE